MTARRYPISICDDCIYLKGEMCHTPECIFCWRTMEEVGKYLDLLLIRPVVDGERFGVEYAFSLPEDNPKKQVENKAKVG